jgi:hypothetical protein
MDDNDKYIPENIKYCVSVGVMVDLNGNCADCCAEKMGNRKKDI